MLFHVNRGTDSHGSTTNRDRGDTNPRNFSAADFRTEIDRLVDASLASNTKDTHRTGLWSFEIFRKDFNMECVWPPPLSHNVLFIACLSLKGEHIKLSAIYVTAISGFHCKEDGFNSLSNTAIKRYPRACMWHTKARDPVIEHSSYNITMQASNNQKYELEKENERVPSIRKSEKKSREQILCKMKVVKILCAMFIVLISVLAGTVSGKPPRGRLEFNRDNWLIEIRWSMAPETGSFII
ncbi:unnamed protein product [Mytilus edulis]|uniref:Uncharacterized protein n=1 Tax=Mytilus edulis TaxID=6550 RepID=A0A8S3S8Q8_MYTED|nr:unnamed protein product [Mytilus edulis]